MPIVDQFSDPAFATLFRQVTRMPALESFVKSASVDTEEANSLPDSAFAWPAERKYPIHTPEHAALSYVYTKVAGSIPPEVVENLEKAIDLYQIPLSTFEETETKVASVQEQYVLPEYKFLPLNTADQVKVAQTRLLEELHKLEVVDRATAAANLVKRANELKVTPRVEVMKLAGLVVSDTRTAADWIEARTARLSDDKLQYKKAYETLAAGMRRGPKETFDRDGLLKVASALAEMDAAAGLEKYYDRKLPDPLQTVFNTTKVAGSTIEVAGAHIPLSKLAQLPASFWEDLGGPELSSEVAPGGVVDTAKLATILETLPLDMKLTLKAQVR